MDYLTSLYLTDEPQAPERRAYRRSLHKVRRDEALTAAYLAGRSVQEVADEFKISRSRAYVILQRSGTVTTVHADRPAHPNGIPTRQRNAEIVEKYKAGANSRQLGEEYGISHERVCQIVRPHNLTNLKAEQKRVARETVEAERAQIASELQESRAEAIARAVEIVRAGGSRNDAIRQTGLPVHLVQKACKDAGLPHLHGRWGRGADIEKRRQRASELRAAGKTWAEIEAITAAEGEKITMNFVVRHFPELMTRIPRVPRSNGRPVTPQTNTAPPVLPSDIWPPEKVAELCRMYFAGCSAQQIADVIGVSRNAIIGKTNRLRADGQLKPPAA